MNLCPFGKTLLVRVLDQTGENLQPIITSGSYLRPVVAGRVLAIGTGVTTVAVGDPVVFSRNEGRGFMDGDESVYLVPESAIVAMLAEHAGPYQKDDRLLAETINWLIAHMEKLTGAKCPGVIQ